MEYVTAFRASRKKLVDTWAGFRRAAYRTVYEGIPSKVDTSRVVFHKVGDSLCMRLPNGRDLYYPKVVLKSNRTPWGADVRSVAYWDYKTKSLKFMTGGNFFQNAVQAVCRDLLMEAQLRLEKKGYKIIMSVHDECIALVPDTDNYSLEEFIDIMTQVPKWATGFPIKADGWEGYRYHK
jgi:DNA polymerase